ncbi:MAG: hypothetical protein H7Z40_15510, partial [Phycisphaerae bacterium]|nr:hypothetical protein [Gemmatimonadaceae bacterium]
MPENRSNPRGGNLRHDNDAFGANSQSGRGGSWSNRDDDDMQMRNSRQDRPRSAYESELNPRMEQGGSHTSAYGDEHSTSGDRYRDSDDNANDRNRKRGNQKPGGRDGGDADMGADSWGGAADRDTGRDRYNQSDSAGASVGYNDPDIDRNDYYGNRSMNEGRDSNRASSRDRQSENEGRNRGPGGSNYNAQQPNERQDANTWGNRNTGGNQQRPGGNQGNFGGARRDFGEDGVRNSGSPQRSHEGQGDYGDRYSGREGGSNQFSSWRNDPSDTRSGSQQGMRGDSQRGQQSDQPQRGQHAGRGPKGYRRDDARITEDVNEALTHDHDIDASEIEVKVSG